MGIEEIITLNISRETTAPTRVGFGIGGFLGASKRFTTRTIQVASPDELIDLGFLSTDLEYVAAQKYFGQETRPSSLIIGRRGSDDLTTLTFDAPVTGKVYTITINGEVLTFTATVTETTAAEVAAAFETANAAGFTAASITFDDAAADGTATIVPTVAATPYSITSEANITATSTYSETLTDAYSAMKGENDDFYFFMCYSHSKADQEELAAAVEADRKVYFTSSNDAVIINSTLSSDTSSIAYSLYNSSYFRTALLYSAVADTQFPEAAFVGEGATSDPGSRTWAYKTLAGISVDALSASQAKNATDKNCNIYNRYLGIPVTRDGKVSGGEWVDIIRGIDWTHSRILARVFSILVNSPKIPYTDAGVSIILAELAAQRQEGIGAGFLAGDADDTITAPQVKDVAFIDRAARILPDVEFRWTMAGAIQFPEINGTVTV